MKGGWYKMLSIAMDILNLMLAILALLFSGLSLHRSRMSQRPYIKLIDMFFDPSEFYCYSSEAKDKYEKFKEEHKKIINNTVGEICSKNIDGREYLLVNMLEKDYNLNNVKLILAPYQFVFTNTGKFVPELRVVKGIFKLKSSIKSRRNVDYKIVPSDITNEEVNIKIAYICQDGFETSVIYPRLLDEKEKFSYKKDNEKAENIVNFKREEYVIIGRSNSNIRYKIKIIFTWKGKLIFQTK